ncbi:glycosyltransferase [Paraburkholderia sp. J7]|uniref:glycosyltransferase n=1 Tax=Paraburkholderia sp. J7 TaxID=2805438 RepID=UPI002AB6376F|nr:glycosyltransferase [Paraburkholderia sp. J7]
MTEHHKPPIFILHPGRANYPEIAAYRAYFTARGFSVSAGVETDYAALSFEQKGRTILWCIMGFYVRRLVARCVIHDYRSLSVGKHVVVKDMLKRYCQARPDIRIFQTVEMAKVVGMHLDHRTRILPMGVPDWIFSAIEAPAGTPSIRGTYCYIGEITQERRIDVLLSDFVSFRQPQESLVLVGEVEEAIARRFASEPGVVFTGRLPQAGALSVVKQCDFAVSTVPYTRPYGVQAPTKLLEYAALGMRIIGNDSPSNLLAAKAHGIQFHMTGPRIFHSLEREALESLPRNDPSRLNELRWDAVIEKSGIEQLIRDTIRGH